MTVLSKHFHCKFYFFQFVWQAGQTALNISACHGDLKSVKKHVYFGASILKEEKVCTP